jgi:hypothetical protein
MGHGMCRNFACALQTKVEQPSSFLVELLYALERMRATHGVAPTGFLLPFVSAKLMRLCKVSVSANAI